MADLRTLQHYLTAGIPVENAGHGRGTLAGLPYNRLGEAVRAHVQFPKDKDQYGIHEDHYALEHVTPVLYSLGDRINEVMELPEWKAVPESMSSLNQMAALIDKIRSMGIALGLPHGSYIVRSAWEAQPPSTEPEPVQAVATPTPALRKKSVTAPYQGDLFA